MARNDRSLAERLMDLREKIQDAKDQKSRAEGQLAEVLKRLKDEFGCLTVKDAERKLEDLRKNIEANENILRLGIEKLEGAMK